MEKEKKDIKKVTPQEFPSFTRNGFTVIEWEGTIL